VEGSGSAQARGGDCAQWVIGGPDLSFFTIDIGRPGIPIDYDFFVGRFSTNLEDCCRRIIANLAAAPFHNRGANLIQGCAREGKMSDPAPHPRQPELNASARAGENIRGRYQRNLAWQALCNFLGGFEPEG
jgi:hypothetical protein